jgi:hypothetical protein
MCPSYRRALILKWRADMHLFQAARAAAGHTQEVSAAREQEVVTAAAAKGVRCYGKALVLLRMSFGEGHKETAAVAELAEWAKAKAKEWQRR